MTTESTHVCPVSNAGVLDFWLRRRLQNPHRLLSPYVRPGMTVLDLGSGPGFFTMALAELVGASGRVIAVDLQEGMLQRLEAKLKRSGLDGRVSLHRCAATKIGLAESVDFVLAFYVVHEIPDHPGLFQELSSILNSNGSVLVVEPPFHVSRAAFTKTIRDAENAGFRSGKGPGVFLSKSVILKKG
jgi:ubiquinone/menaquinone biosynthesis C-methylase UbiE